MVLKLLLFSDLWVLLGYNIFIYNSLVNGISLRSAAVEGEVIQMTGNKKMDIIFDVMEWKRNC